MMARYIIFRDRDGLVTNAVEWSGDTTKWSPPKGHSTLQTDRGNPGDTWDGVQFTTPPIAPPRSTTMNRLVDILANKIVKDAMLQDQPILTSVEQASLKD